MGARLALGYCAGRRQRDAIRARKDAADMIRPMLSASQTLGPFFHDGMLRADAVRTKLAAPGTAGEHIRIVGHVYDGDGLGVPDAMIEIWQANHYGRYNHPSDGRDLPIDPTFHGFGRAASDAVGCYCFETIKPGRVPFDEYRLQAPH